MRGFSHEKILRIDASMRREGSHSRSLLDTLISRYDPAQIKVQQRDLSERLPFVNERWIEANFTDAAERTEEQRSVLALSDTLVAELKAADTILMASPIYNFHIPAAFKAWIDLIARARETFRYSENGPVGLLENKRSVLILTSGGTRLGSSIDFVSDYLRHVFGFIGLHNLTLIDASGIGRDQERIINNAREQIEALAL